MGAYFSTSHFWLKLLNKFTGTCCFWVLGWALIRGNTVLEDFELKNFISYKVFRANLFVLTQNFRFIGCDHRQIDKNGNLTTIRRCQCSKNYCNINFDLDFGKIQPSLRPRPAISPTLAPTPTNLTILNSEYYRPNVYTFLDLAQQSSSELPIYSTASNIEETTQNLSSIAIDPLTEDINFYHIEMQESRKYQSKNRNLIIDPVNTSDKMSIYNVYIVSLMCIILFSSK